MSVHSRELHAKRANSIQHVNNVTSARRSKTFYDVNTETPEITVGSKVLLHYDVVKPGESPKFHSLARPILVISKSDDGLSYTQRHCCTGKQPRAAVHAHRLNLYNDDRDSFICGITSPRRILRSRIRRPRYLQLQNRQTTDGIP